MQTDITDIIDLAPFEARHLEDAVALSQAAGWPHRKEDWAMVWGLSEGRVALAGDRVVGTALMTPFGRACATVNLIIVDQTIRGRGLGRRLTMAAVELADARECRLVATSDGLPLYEKLGFHRTHDIFQHQGLAAPVTPPTNVEWAGAKDLKPLIDLDAVAFGADRRDLFAVLASQGQFAVTRDNGHIVAFAAVRPFGRGEVIGPVVGQSEDQARALIAFILASRKGRFVRVDVAGKNDLAPWLENLGLAHVGGGIAMSRGGSVPRKPAAVQTFALASQALG